MKELLDICEGLLLDKCIRHKDAIICYNNTIRVVWNDGLLARVSVNLSYIQTTKTLRDRIEKLPVLVQLPYMEITMLADEAETIGVWLALALLGHEPARPADLLCWPSGDYAWTLRAAEIGKPERRFS